MSRIRTAALHALVGAALLLGPPAQADPPPAFDGSRAALEIPDAVWDRVRADAGRPGGRIGYTPDELRAFRNDAFLLRGVQALFADVRRIPRESGRITDGLLDNAGKLSEVLARGYALTDVSSGRMLELPKDLRWGRKDLEDAATPVEALGRLAAQVEGDLNALPEPVQRLLVRLIVGCDAAVPWLWLAGVPPEKRTRGTVEGPRTELTAAEVGRVLSLAALESEATYAALRAPLIDDVNGQAATLEGGYFHFLRTFDRDLAAYGAMVAAVHLERALAELEPALAGLGPTPLPAPITLTTRWGVVRVFGSGDDVATLPADTLISLDLGGNDAWSGHVGASGLGHPVGLHLDLGGNDTYREDAPARIAAGFMGLGWVVDLAGDDTYDVKASGLGCGLFGTGVLWDRAGDDSYRSRGPWGQGAGHAGVGALLDVSGNDDYECTEQAQGLGGTLGAGLLIDLKGNDTYVARDDGNISELYKGQSVAMAQGCGYGRRADIGDGRSLAGGVGILLDGAGDDRYHAQVWAQGCGYWWALGILEDRGGDDQYQNGKYSAGAAAHFALGVCIDLAGDDVHNANNPTSVNQWHGHARDGSVGVFVDGDGDDGYDVNNHCAGSADLNSIALFWDRRGDDRYTFHDKALGPANGWTDTGAFGTVTRYTPFRSFRDDLPAWGLFLDTGGKDSYGVETAPTTFAATPAADGSTWVTAAGPLVFGLGYDLDGLYPPR